MLSLILELSENVAIYSLINKSNFAHNDLLMKIDFYNALILIKKKHTKINNRLLEERSHL